MKPLSALRDFIHSYMYAYAHFGLFVTDIVGIHEAHRGDFAKPPSVLLYRGVFVHFVHIHVHISVPFPTDTRSAVQSTFPHEVKLSLGWV